MEKAEKSPGKSSNFNLYYKGVQTLVSKHVTQLSRWVNQSDLIAQNTSHIAVLYAFE